VDYSVFANGRQILPRFKSVEIDRLALPSVHISRSFSILPLRCCHLAD